MRLRYLHLPEYGPLRDFEVVFGRDSLLYRKGTINFVVGVNGSGKSSVLRAIYETFRHLDRACVPPFPVTLVYDIGEAQQTRSVIFHHPGGPASEAILQIQPMPYYNDPAGVAYLRWTAQEWRNLVDALRQPVTHRGWVPSPIRIAGSDLQGNNEVTVNLPQQVVAYTSGNLDAWTELFRPWCPSDELPTGSDPNPAERLFTWNRSREVSLRLAHDLAEHLQQLAYDIRGESEGGRDVLRRFGDELEELRQMCVQQVNSTGLEERSGESSTRCLLMPPSSVWLAAISLGIWQAAKESADLREESAREAFRAKMLESPDGGKAPDIVRRVLNELNWLFPTHLSLILNPAAERRRDKITLFVLHSLADAVIEQPLNRLQLVFSLGSGPRLENFSGAVKSHFRSRPPEVLQEIASALDGVATKAEALVRLFSEKQAVWELFHVLHRWQAEGLLERATVTVLRTNTGTNDSVITLESFSDGEQALLGRLALIFLLQNIDESLLLLDEPETHFNDTWKRELVDFVDASLLKTMSSQVVFATHTSIALTDVFRSEIVALERDRVDGQIGLRELTEPTFGATPADIMRRVFGAKDTVGRRAMEFLDSILVLTNYPDELAAMWREPIPEQALDALCDRLAQHPQVFGENPDRARVVSLLQEFRALAGEDGRPVDALRRLAENVGPGHYRFEITRRLSILASR